MILWHLNLKTKDVNERSTAEINTDAAASAHPGLASRMWHSVVDPILHPKKPEPNDEKLAAGHNVDEKPDENQSDVQQEVEEVHAPHQVPDTSEMPEVEPEGEIAIAPSTPEAVQDQSKVETVESVPLPDDKGAGDGKDRKKHRHEKKSHHKDRASRSVMYNLQSVCLNPSCFQSVS